VQGKGFEVEALGVQPHFFDVNEDSPSVPRQWCLEVGDIETDVSDNFAFDQTARRVGPEAAALPDGCSRFIVCLVHIPAALHDGAYVASGMCVKNPGWRLITLKL